MGVQIHRGKYEARRPRYEEAEQRQRDAAVFHGVGQPKEHKR